MTDSPYETLGSGICPWLQAPLRQFEAALRDGRLGHGWLLAGPQGIGKINLALAVARRLLEGTRDPARLLDAAEATRAMLGRHEPADHHPDLHWLFPEQKRHTLTVEQIRGATRALSLTSLTSQAKVLVLEPADAMTAAASNALLKTLEEPSADTYLLLVSHQPGRLPATIRSRCQSLPVRCPPVAEAAAWLNGPGKEQEAVDWTSLLAASQGRPFHAIRFHRGGFFKNYSELEDKLCKISTARIDPQMVADEWLASDIEATLSWLSAQLQATIRARLAAEFQRSGSDSGSDSGTNGLTGAWRSLQTRFLFQQLGNTELLLGQLGGGINVELAVRALLCGFQPRGGRQ